MKNPWQVRMVSKLIAQYLDRLMETQLVGGGGTLDDIARVAGLDEADMKALIHAMRRKALGMHTKANLPDAREDWRPALLGDALRDAREPGEGVLSAHASSA